MTKELNEIEIKQIKNRAKEKLGLCRKANDIIGTQIFSIIGLYARVIYYPLGKEAPWGFTRISGSKNDSALEKPFVAINSSIPVECQVFAAAHELYHIWYEQNPDMLPADLLNEQDKNISEKKANRFAAEFLVDEQLLKQEIDMYMIKKITLKSILQLADLFTVPYRTMTKRLREINAITDMELSKFLAETEESIDKYRKRYSLSSQKTDDRIIMDNLVELAVNAFEAGYITYEKLEYLLSMSNLNPEALGIVNKDNYEFPSDDELDSIMEE
ncbi:ImmA/IrrE family metallo-endopeptidase [Blautia schinkii]|nr:ImmA/IrrE family metallo-endopeptidase [Blautia schinkii]